MSESLLITEEGIILLLLAISIVMSIVLRKIKFPYTIGLFIIGFVIAFFIAPAVGFLSPLSGYVPETNIILYLFLPPLIFESAIALNSRLLFKNIVPVMVMAVIGLIVSVFIIGILLSFFTSLPIIYALLFGALISATDPVAVIALFKDFGVPKRLFTLVEGESLLNDASAIVTFNLIMGVIAILAYSSAPPIGGLSLFFAYSLLVSFVGGILIGLVMALAIYGTIKVSPDHPHMHQTVSLVIAYSAFIVSEAIFNFSGVIAVVAAGILVNRMVSRRLGPSVREDLHDFWGYIGFLANSMIFLLVGISITGLEESFVLSWEFAFAAVMVIVAVVIARAVSVYGLYGITNIIEKKRPVPLSYQTVIFWGGLRGAVCLALVLSIPEDFPYHDALVAFTVIVVVFTILVLGMTTGPLIRIFGLQRPENVLEFERLWLSVRSSKESLKAVDRMREDDILPEASIDNISGKYEVEASDIREKFSEFWNNCPDDNSIRELFWIKAIEYEQQGYRYIYDKGMIPPNVFENLIYDSITRLDKIQSEGIYPSGKRYYSPLVAVKLHFRRNLSVLSGIFKRRGENEDLVDEMFLTFAVSVVSLRTRDWVLKVADETAAGRVIVDPIVEEYGRMHDSAGSGFSDLALANPEVAESFYSYITSEIAISGAKEMVFEAKEKGFFDENEIETEISRLRKEESLARKRVQGQ